MLITLAALHANRALCRRLYATAHNWPQSEPPVRLYYAGVHVTWMYMLPGGYYRVWAVDWRDG